MPVIQQNVEVDVVYFMLSEEISVVRVGLDVIDPCYDLEYLAVVLVVAGQLQSHHEQ
jgi:hypothetical protein